MMEWDIALGAWVFTHTLSGSDLQEFIGKDKNPDIALYNRSLAVAYSLVDDALQSAPITRKCPDAVYDQIVLEVAAGISKRRNNSSQIEEGATFSGGGVPIRGPKNPLEPVWTLINQYAGFGIG